MLSIFRKSYLLCLSCPVIPGLRVLTTDNTEQSKVKIIKFLLHICIKCKIILCDISFSVIFKPVAFANLLDKQVEKQQTIVPLPHLNLLKFLTDFFPPLPPLTSENLQSYNLLVLMLHF